MIITRISAGMGNQMFMYAAGLALSQRLNTELKLDIYEFGDRSFRKYALNTFPNITEESASFRDIYKLAPFMAIADYFHVRGNSIFKHPFRRLMYECMNRVGLLEGGRAARKQRHPGSVLAPIPFSRVYFPQVPYPEEFTKIQDDTYITGFWESEKFFTDITGLVREKFTFPDECFDPELTARLKAGNSIAVHVRLGDKADSDDEYVSRLTYYLKNALPKLESLSDEPEYFVFSDNIDWCRKNLHQLHDAEYTFIEGETPAQDMALMTQCRHVIMSFSTFSWWGAWLNRTPNKIIIAPESTLWQKPETYNPEDRKYFLPPEWIKIR